MAAIGSASAQTSASSDPNVTVLPTEIIGSTEPTPEAPAAARREARRESARDARRDCLAAAHEDFRNTLARAAIGS